MRFILSFILLLQSVLFAQDNFVVSLDHAISPGSLAICKDAFKEAEKAGAKVIIMELDTPGGLVTSTREIIREIRDSKIPVVVYVAPAGAQAASAGTFIVYASHLAAMAPVTNIGAATPVSLTGDLGEDKDLDAKKELDATERSDEKSEAKDEDTPKGIKSQAEKMEDKIMNDLYALARSLAEETGRNEEFIIDAIKTAKSISAREALASGAIELIAKSREDLLQQMQGREVIVQGERQTINSNPASVQVYQLPLRLQILSLITDPSVAYLLILAGIYGILLELYSPGSLFPGVLGAVSLILAGYALNLLPVNFAGVMLIIVGSVLLLAEAMMPSFGVLGFGGIIAMTLGGLFLFDTALPGYGVGNGAFALSGVLMLFVFILARMMLKAQSRVPRGGHEALVNKIARCTQPIDPEGEILVLGERWGARSTQKINQGEKVVITKVQGLICHVSKQEEENGS